MEITIFTVLAHMLLIGMATAGEPVICTWARDKSAAVSLTFDDALPNQFSIAVPLLNDKNIQATFLVPYGGPAYSAVVAAGHEIGSHADIWGSTDPDMLASIGVNRDNIDNNQPEQRCASFAYVNGYSTPQQRALMPNYFLAARAAYITNGHTPEDSVPADMYNLACFDGSLAGRDGSFAQHASVMANDAIVQRGWSIILLHDINSTGTNAMNNTSVATLGLYLDTINAHADQLWAAPMGTVARYIWERRFSAVKAVSSSSAQLEYQLTSSLDSVFNYATMAADSLFTCPLTIKTDIPAGWIAAWITQDGRLMWSEIVASATGNMLLFEAIPGRGNITVSSEAPNSAAQSMVACRRSVRESGARWLDIRGRAIMRRNAAASCAGIRIAADSRGQRFLSVDGHR